MIWFKRFLLPILLLALPKFAIAQQTRPIDDGDVPYLVAFTSGNDSAIDRWCSNAITKPTDPVMQEIVSACRVRVIDAKKPAAVYDTRYAGAIDESRLPCIAFTNAKGGVLYVADRTALPPNESALAREIQFFADAAENAIEITQDNWPNSNRGEISFLPQQDCPDGICPVPVAPNDVPSTEQRKPLFPRLRNSQEPKNIMDNWFSTNYQGISPTTMIIILTLIVLAIFLRGNGNGST